MSAVLHSEAVLVQRSFIQRGHCLRIPFVSHWLYSPFISINVSLRYVVLTVKLQAPVGTSSTVLHSAGKET